MNKIIEVKYNKTNNRESITKENFHYNELGIYLGAGNWHDSAHKGDEIIDIVKKNKFNKDHFINNVKTLHRLPDLTLSRDKLSQFKEECNFRVVRDKEIADICVLGEKTISNMIDHTYRSTCTFSKFKNHVKELSERKEFLTIKDKDITFINNAIQQIEDTYGENIMIAVDSNSYYYGDDNDSKYTKMITEFLEELDNFETDCNSRGNYNWYVKYESYPLYNWIKDKANEKKIIMDTDLNKLCVQDSVPLTKKEFERLVELIISRDEDNVNIGLTLMANCNVEESKTELSLLFAFYSDDMKGTKVWTHVNFKYLKKIFDNYINVSLSSWGNSYDNLIQKMCEDKCLTLWSSRYIANAMFKRVLQSSLGTGRKNSVFSLTADDLKLKPEYLDQLIDENDNKLSELVTINEDLPF